MTVAITRKDMSARELRTAAAKTADAKAARRLLAIALVPEDVDRKTAAESCGMDRQTLRDWGHRYNAEGLEGLSARRSAGPTPRLSPAQKVELAQTVRKGPDPATDGVVRWRRRDLRVLTATGPERIAPEWWLDDPEWRSGPRDYWRVVTNTGDRLWLFFAHGADLSPGWFCHGRFG